MLKDAQNSKRIGKTYSKEEQENVDDSLDSDKSLDSEEEEVMRKM